MNDLNLVPESYESDIACILKQLAKDNEFSLKYLSIASNGITAKQRIDLFT